MSQVSLVNSSDLAVNDPAQLAFQAFSQSKSGGNYKLDYFTSYSAYPAADQEQQEVVDQVVSAPEVVFTAAYNYAVNVRQNQRLINETDDDQQQKILDLVDNARNGITSLNWADHPQHRQDLTRSSRNNPGRFHASEAGTWLLKIGSEGYQAGVRSATPAQLVAN